LRDLRDVCTAMDNVRRRELVVQQQMSKRRSLTPYSDEIGLSETSLNSSTSTL
jgi:hypothetical protein